MGQRQNSFPGLRGIGGVVARIVRPAFKRRGFSQGDIVTRWRSLVGDTLADVSRPERLRFAKTDTPAVLHVRVKSVFAPEFLHLVPVVIERINSFYGYKAVGDIRLIQGVIEGDGKSASRPLSLPAVSTAELPEIKDPELRSALESLQNRLSTRNNRNKSINIK